VNCGRVAETTVNLFFECAEVKLRWIKATRILKASKMSFRRVISAFDIIATAVQKHHKNPALLVLVAERVWSAWVERNLRVSKAPTAESHCRLCFGIVQ
jgi:hypothetical protein